MQTQVSHRTTPAATNPQDVLPESQFHTVLQRPLSCRTHRLTPPSQAFLLPHVLEQCYEGGPDFLHALRDHLHFYGSSDPIICPHASGHQSVSLDVVLWCFFLFFFFKFPRCPLISLLSASRSACAELCRELLC